MNTIPLAFVCVSFCLAAISASSVGQPSERQKINLKTNELRNFLSKVFGHGSPTLKRNAAETDEDDAEGSGTDVHEIDENENNLQNLLKGQTDNESSETWGAIDDDDKETYRQKTSASKGWKNPKETDLTYVFISFTRDRPENETRREIKTSFEDWSNVTRLKFTETEFENASIRLLFRYFKRPAWSSELIAVTRGNTIVFNENKNWNGGPMLRLIATHEIGHCLGLGHSKRRRSIMYPEYVNRKNFTLSLEDIERIQAIYGRPTTTAATPIPQRDSTTWRRRRGDERLGIGFILRRETPQRTTLPRVSLRKTTLPRESLRKLRKTFIIPAKGKFSKNNTATNNYARNTSAIKFSRRRLTL